MSDVLTYDVSASVATITMSRPDAMNALTTELKNTLRSALESARDDSSVRAVVLTGSGRAFCSGQDLREHATALEQMGGESLRGTIETHYNPIAVLLATMPKPVIAAVNGMAAGAGASFAFACDFRLAADSASFLMAFTRVGLTVDSGASWTLQRLVGYGRATALMLLAEPVSAEQALEMGLVNAVVPADRLADASRELAERLAAGPTLAYAETKAALAHAASAEAGLDEIIAHGNRYHYKRPYGYRRGPNWFKTGDGSHVSIIAGWGTYCSPRPDWPFEGGAPEDYEGPFTAVEAWLPGNDDPEQIDVDELRKWIADHGGLVAGPAEYEKDLP